MNRRRVAIGAMACAGLVLGAAFRFVLYRFWVFDPNRSIPKASVPAVVPAAATERVASR